MLICFHGFACTCSQAQWGTRQRCCCKQCHNNSSPLCSFGSSLVVPRIWLMFKVTIFPDLLNSPELPGNPGVRVQAMTNPQCQGNRARPSDAENHLLFLKLLLTSINIVAKTSESMIQVFHMRVQNWTLKYKELNVYVQKVMEDDDNEHLKQVLLVRNYVSLHSSRQTVHSLQVWAKWSWCGHGGNKTAVSFFQLARHQILGLTNTDFTDWPPMW